MPRGRERSSEAAALRARVESHPVHKCPEIGRHLHFADRAARLQKEISGIDRRINRRTGTLARRFEKVLEVLEKLHYVESWALTDKGEHLTRIYNESDLLVTEALERHLFDDLNPAELAAVCSTLVYETRGPEPTVPGEMPTVVSAGVWKKLLGLWLRIRREEEVRGLDLTREPDPGFAAIAYDWCSGASLDTVIGEEDAPGDFVRSTKQLVDLMRQLEEVAPTAELADKVRTAIDSLHRGVVAYSSLDL